MSENVENQSVVNQRIEFGPNMTVKYFKFNNMCSIRNGLCYYLSNHNKNSADMKQRVSKVL